MLNTMYEEANSLNAVAEFHESFGHPILTQPTIPSEQRSNLRVSLIQEELNELKQAIDEKNLVEIADALCDIQYVLAGAIHEFGLGKAFAPLFSEVQRSNMSKACSSEPEANETISNFHKDGIECHFEMKGNYFIVYRNDDHKIMKSVYYSPADLQSIINRYSQP